MTSAWTAVRWGSPLVVLATVTWLRRSLVCVTVTGESMMPGLRPGDLVVVRRGTIKSLRAGSVVVVREPPLDGCDAMALKPPPGWPHAWVIKRLAALPGQPVPDAVRPAVGGVTVVPDQMIVILGDNSAESRDSRDWGFIPAEDALGRVIRRLTTFRVTRRASAKTVDYCTKACVSRPTDSGYAVM